MSALSVVLLAIWIAPDGFGYWAAATSATAIAAAFVNFGEVNGYLSGHGSNFAQTRRSVFRGNLLLALVGSAISVAYAIAGNVDVAILSATIAITFPLIGDSDLLYSAGVKHKLYRRVVTSQVASAIAKLAIGVGLAWWTQSAIAIAAATAAYYIVVELVLGRKVARHAIAEEPDSAPSPAISVRAKWALNSVFQTLPIQIGFLVTQFIADPALLGIYYLAYQATLAVSGVIVAPISRVTLSTFARTELSARAKVAAQISTLIGATLLACGALATLLGPLLAPLLSEQWQAAVPAALVLFASLPVRIVGPILDAYQQSHDRWWQSTAFNVADTVLTGLASLAALSGDVVLLAAAVSLAKILLGTVRTAWVFGAERAAIGLQLALPLAIGSIALVVGGTAGLPTSTYAGAGGLLLALSWAAIALRRRR